jgi:hypothetical protein
MRRSLVPNPVNIDLEHKDFTLSAWILVLIRERRVSVGAEELRQLPMSIAVSSLVSDEACRAQVCQDVCSSFRRFEHVDSRLYGLGW